MKKSGEIEESVYKAMFYGAWPRFYTALQKFSISSLNNFFV